MTITTSKPFSLTIIGNSHRVFQEVCSHVRNGYVVNPDASVEVFPESGHTIIQLVLGNPLEYAEADAKATIDNTIALEQVEFERRVKAEAKRLVEEDKAAAIRKQLATQAAEHTKAVKKLEAQLAAL